MIETLALALVVGYAAWTVMEFVFHRLGHLRGQRKVTVEHRQHHVHPDYFTPRFEKAKAIVPLIVALGGASLMLVEPLVAATITVGIFAGWVHYEWLHQRIHLEAPRGAYGRWARRHHLHHHFGNPRTNFGVTTPVWDWALRSRHRPEQVLIPRRFATLFPWLVEESDGELRVAARYRDEYRLSGRAASEPGRAT